MSTKENTRDKIIRISKNLFSRKGFDATSMSHISTAVGINKASIYYFFKNKEAIYFEIIKSGLNKISDYLNKIEPRKDPENTKNDKINFISVIEKLIEMNMKEGVVPHILDSGSLDKRSKEFISIHKGMGNIRKAFENICRLSKIENPEIASLVTLNAIHAYIVQSSCKGLSIKIKPKDYARYLAKLLENK